MGEGHIYTSYPYNEGCGKTSFMFGLNVVGYNPFEAR